MVMQLKYPGVAAVPLPSEPLQRSSIRFYELDR